MSIADQMGCSSNSWRRACFAGSQKGFASHPLAGLLGRLNHVAVATGDLEKTAKFYKDLDAKVSATVPLPEHGVYTVFVELPPDTKLELLLPLGDKSPIQAFLNKNKSGVSNLLEFVPSMRSQKSAPTTNVFLHPKDCGGVLVELEQE
ncbi:unnamed protein product, partial [Mesorhabditis belari]|uniref:VOC domain-containing protein n=1 Tax=Mesorhabditis belari TaxID=2138241 RepID=A0AAF3J8E7_9BILA